MTLDEIRHTCRAIVTAGMNDQMEAAAALARELASDPHTAGMAVLALAEIVDVALHGYAAGSGQDQHVLWQKVVAEFAAHDAEFQLDGEDRS